MRLILPIFLLLLIELLFQSYYLQLVKEAVILRWLFIGMSSCLTVLLILGITAPINTRVLLGASGYNFLRAFLIIVLLSKFVALLPALIDGMRIGIQWLFQLSSDQPPGLASRSRFLALGGVVLGLIPFVSLTYGMLRNPYRYKLHRIPLQLAGSATKLKGLRIVQISDIHCGSFLFRSPVENAIKMINELDADIVLFTGDLVNNHAEELLPYLDMFAGIRAKFGVYSVLGNHDYGDYTSWKNRVEKDHNFRQICDLQKQMGWHLLRNEHKVLDLKNGRVGLIGVENISAHPYFRKYGNLSVATHGMEDTDLNILLSHDPTHWDMEVKNAELNIHLTCSGHTHGFQFGVEIPGFKWSPSQYMYKKWSGLYEEGGKLLYVNRGFGYLAYPGRVGILPEITLLEII
jgi:predicted MPP superfamily phosphohydrolase